MSKFLDRDHPMFRQAWVRWATVAFPLAWGAFEFYNGSPGWGIVFVGAGLWALWELVLRR